MIQPLVFDRVKETTTVTGTGPATLLGASSQFQTFSSHLTDTDTTYYCISDQSGANWETGLGTYAVAGNTLTRTTILGSSNAGAAVSFTAGVKDIYITVPAMGTAYTDPTGSTVLVSGTTNPIAGFPLGSSAITVFYFGGAVASGLTTGASHNICGGINAGASISTGTNNTIIGTNSAVTGLTTNSNNTLYGDNVGFAMSGSGVTAMGSSAALNLTTGINNTFYGYLAGQGITTGAGNTVIGANIAALAAGLTNNIVIANSTGSIRIQSDATSCTFADIIKPPQYATAGAPAYQKGAIYFDTTLNKLRVGGATAWETITSA